MHSPLIFTGNANRPLAEAIARQLGIAVGRALVSTFQDGETQVDVADSVRDGDVFIIQPTCPPVNDNLMELLIMMDAMHRASARRMTAVVPYYGYSRQEKRSKGREPISAKLVANLMATAGADHVLTMDLTAPAIEGFFDIPVDNLGAGRILAEYCLKDFSLHDAVVVSPDVGGVNRANKFRQMIGTQAELAVIFKEHPEAETTEMLGMVGEVTGKTAIIVDDIISTGATLTKAAELLIERGASKVYACATHPVFAEGAIERINDSVIETVLVTDSIPVPRDQCGTKIKVASVASLLADAITSIHEGRTMADLYKKLKARPIKGRGATMRFRDRQEAGQLLAEELDFLKGKEDVIVLGIPRGGVVVAYEVAQAIGVPLDVYITRKIGAPHNPELAIGAVASDEGVVLDHDLIRQLGVSESYVERETERQRQEIERRAREYRGDRPPLELAGKTVIVVDDGVATGATTVVTLRALKKQEPKELILAIPVGPPDTVRQLGKEADRVICLSTPRLFWAVGAFYAVFDQTSDAEVKRLLGA